MRQKNLEHVCEVGTMEPEQDAVPAKQNGLEPKRDKLRGNPTPTPPTPAAKLATPGLDPII